MAEHARAPNPRLAEFLLLTLDAMAGLGLHDQLGGGFFRYTVDPSWKTPHFEKMLYDNAQLARLYLDAARVFRRDDYRTVAYRTLDFLLRDMADASGGFIAALSALDEQGVEGGYYLWSQAQLEATLSAPELAAYRLHAGMTEAAPFERGWLPLAVLPAPEVAQQLKGEPAEVAARIRSAQTKLRTVRAKRGLPRDTKVLAAWNGLALSAFTAAAREDARYRPAAQALRDMLVKQMWDGQQLARSRVAGKTGGKVALEDYAYVVAGLTDWAALTGADGDTAMARDIARVAWQRFYGKTGWRLEEASLLVAETGQDTVSDGHLPSPSALLIESSLRLAARSNDTDLRRRALGAANSGHRLFDEGPFWHASLIAARMRAAELRP